jgi:hypothetical protein
LLSGGARARASLSDTFGSASQTASSLPSRLLMIQTAACRQLDWTQRRSLRPTYREPPAAEGSSPGGDKVGVDPLGDDPGLRRLLAGALAPELFDGPPPRHLADEINLVTRWLEGAAGEGELLWVRGRLASPAVGGAMPQLRYDPGRHRHAWPPGEARGRPEARPSRRSARRRPGSLATTGW